MFNLIKGTTLFFSKGDGQIFEIAEIIKFLSDEYNFIYINTGVDKFGISPLVKSVKSNPEKISDNIKDNLFRLDGVCIYIPQKLKDYKLIWNQLKEFENLYIIVICPELYRLDVIPTDMVVFRQIYEVKDNPEWFKKMSFGGPPFNSQKIPDVDRYIFINSLTEDEFTLKSFKLSYIRDKKIDIFLDNNEDN
jgi:hypothetical protein